MSIHEDEYVEPDEIEDDDEQEDDAANPSVTRKGTLTKFIRSKEDIRITSIAKDVLMAQLDQLAMILIKRAAEASRNDNRQTIFPKHLEAAYEELLKPHVFVDQIINVLEEQKDQLQHLARSSLLRYMEGD